MGCKNNYLFIILLSHGDISTELIKKHILFSKILKYAVL